MHTGTVPNNSSESVRVFVCVCVCVCVVCVCCVCVVCVCVVCVYVHARTCASALRPAATERDRHREDCNIARTLQEHCKNIERTLQEQRLKCSLTSTSGCNAAAASPLHSCNLLREMRRPRRSGPRTARAQNTGLCLGLLALQLLLTLLLLLLLLLLHELLLIFPEAPILFLPHALLLTQPLSLCLCCLLLLLQV